jgi:HTH-type transcriptional regulator, sugar sensing transcriptional regulator
MIDLSSLTRFNLSEAETKTYATLIEVGPSTASDLSLKSGITRVNTYAVLSSLGAKGLIKTLGNQKVARYEAESPLELERVLNQGLSEMQESVGAFEAILPALLSDYNLSHNKPGVIYYEGIKGIKKIYENILRDKPSEVLVFRSSKDKAILGDYQARHAERRAELGIKIKVISSKSVTPELKAKDKRLLKERKYVPVSMFNPNTEIDIYGNQVIFIAFGNQPLGFVINSANVAKSLAEIFNLVWASKS